MTHSAKAFSDTAEPENKLRTTLRLGAISFINTLPVYGDLPHALPASESAPAQTLNIHYAPPAALNAAMANRTLDVSPVSSAFYLQNAQDFVRLDDLSVSSYGSVNSVLFVSKKPFEESLEHTVISVPDDSATSIALLAHLIEDACGSNPETRFQSYPAANYRQVLAATGCALVIGDNALSLYETGIPEGYYSYDLATLWNEKTGLPFVFAVWVAQRSWTEKHPAVLRTLNEALCASRNRFLSDAELQQHIVRRAHERCQLSAERIQHYFTESLNYQLGVQHEQSLAKFHALLPETRQQQRPALGKTYV